MTKNEILDLIEKRDYLQIKQILFNMNSVDIADVFSQLEKADLAVIFRLLQKDKAADVFSYLDHDTQKHLVNLLTDKEISQIINDLFLDDAVDFIEEMPANVVTRVLRNTSEKMRAQINQFLQYDKDSAGSIMTIEFIDLKHDIKVEQAFDVIRKKAFDKETIYTCYVKDDTRKLVGVVTVRELLLASKDALINSIMETNVISARTTDDKEALGQLFTKYGLLALPVVDSENRLVGIVTIDDALTVIEEEATEDIEKMAALTPAEKPYLKTSVFQLALNRVVWMLILMLGAMFTGLIIERFEASISALPILVGFIPMLMDTGGNAGAQSSTLIIRGMAVGEIKPSDAPKIFWKELRVALIIGVILGVFVISRIMIFNNDPSRLVIGDAQNSPFNLALAVALSLMCTIIMAKMLGGFLPIAAKTLKLDPAIMAAPIITTIVDALSLLVYFGFLNLFITGL